MSIPGKATRARLQVERFGPIEQVDLDFGDLTVLVGPQATGKSLVLEMLKLAIDTRYVRSMLSQHGFAWGSSDELNAVYFGAGIGQAWTKQTIAKWQGREIRPTGGTRSTTPRVFFIPAHRTLALAEGWPLHFQQYRPDTPYVVREFSEKLHELATTELARIKGPVFPQERRLKAAIRRTIDEAVFHGAKLRMERTARRREFRLDVGRGESLAYMSWTAGQREVIPLLLGLYHLIPAGKSSRRDPYEWCIVEELEMGLHPQAILAIMLLILELTHRGYRVVLSTHSPLVLDVVWALQRLRKAEAGSRAFRQLFGLTRGRHDLDALAESSFQLRSKVHYLHYQDGRTVSRDISGLDPWSDDAAESGWGGLTDFSSRILDVVADVVAKSEAAE